MTSSPAQTRALGRRLGETARPGDALLLLGPVGAGKTVLADGFLAGLGVPGPHASPTFTLMRVYQGRLPVAHLDLYRLVGEMVRHPEDAELDLSELLASGGVAVVEWAEALPSGLVTGGLRVQLARTAHADQRQMELTASGERAVSWATVAAGTEEAG